ncbi:MAG: ABC transporter substrate-binding protein [Firmicutes bacterium]|nr:ABC transporter substrate-binding protein [Bacillota bacterium]
MKISRSAKVAVASGLVLSFVTLSSFGAFAANRPAAKVPHGGTVTYINVSGSLDVDNFNPFSPDYMGSNIMQIFEPLLFYNLYTGAITPKLATSYHYENNHKTIVFDLRKGVKWSNGKPFTAQDVAFTFNLILKNPAIDLNNLSSMIASVKVDSPYQVSVNLKAPNVTDLYYIGTQTPIIPESQWKSVENPATFTDPHPVTTGPFLVGSVTRNKLVLVRNPHYWGAPAPYISKIVYPDYISNNTANLAMGQGDFTIAQQYIPDIQTVLLDKSPHYQDWFPDTSEQVLYLNDALYPISLLPFRQALNDVINRAQISRVGEEGYEPPANAVGIPVNPLNNTEIDATVNKKYAPEVSVSRAKAILKKAGFYWKNGQLYTPKGSPVSLTVLATSGYTDTIADAGILVQELHQIGINAVLKTPSGSTVTADLDSGKFQAAFGFTDMGAGVYYEYYPLLDSAFTAPIGQTAISNYERWNNAETNRLLAEYAVTFSPAKQKQILDQLETIFAKNLPVIPITGAADWQEYNTTDFTGFPTAKNPYDAFDYAFGSEYIFASIHRK